MRISDWSSDVCSSDLHLYVVTVEANWLQIRGNTMMRRAITLAALIMFAAPASARPAACSTIDGAVIVADDGTYLGKVADAYDGKSIFNKYGTHGSPYSGNSVWNNYGPYGSEYSNQSARSK